MAQIAARRDAHAVGRTLHPNPAVLEELGVLRGRSGPVEVHSEEGRLGFLEAVLFEEHLLLLRAPQAHCALA
jgi:hypothetical protein